MITNHYGVQGWLKQSSATYPEVTVSQCKYRRLVCRHGRSHGVLTLMCQPYLFVRKSQHQNSAYHHLITDSQNHGSISPRQRAPCAACHDNQSLWLLRSRTMQWMRTRLRRRDSQAVDATLCDSTPSPLSPSSPLPSCVIHPVLDSASKLSRVDECTLVFHVLHYACVTSAA